LDGTEAVRELLPKQADIYLMGKSATMQSMVRNPAAVTWCRLLLLLLLLPLLFLNMLLVLHAS
jgi:hypothetical protein